MTQRITDRPRAPMLSRRLFLKTGALIGCSAAASPWLTTVTFAAAPWDARLVVIVLRGAMDGLDAIRPVGDPNYAALRPTLNSGQEAVPLDSFYAMNPALAPLLPLWQAGELAVSHAVSTPYRDKRSHFDGQDMLEAGTGMDVPLASVRDGWLNRMLQSVPGLTADTAYAVGTDEMRILNGTAPHMNWAPDVRLALSPQSRSLLERAYHDDPLFRDASTDALDITDDLAAEAAQAAAAGEDGGSDMMGNGMMAKPAPAPAGAGPVALAKFAAGRLKGDTRIASFSISGWDTHRGQVASLGKSLSGLAKTILTLRDDLGDVWKKTTVLAMTEFGRTAHENGTGGTDHGTAGAMILAGGAIRGGRVYGKWPGLTEADLYARRDLMPTADVRAHAAWAMRGLYGLDRGLLETKVFPGLDMGGDPGLIL